MSWSREIKDFTEGFTQGYKIYADIEQRKETAAYHAALEKHWNEKPGTSQSEADKAIAAEAEKRERAPGITGNVGGTSGGGANKPTLTPEILNDKDQLKALIRQAEAKGDYGALVYKNDGKPGGSQDFSNMTVDQVLAFQSRMVPNGHASTALGGYQFTAPTLKGLINTLGISGDTKFTNDLQDKLADELLRQRGYDDWKAKGGSPDKFLWNLSQEWASLPNPRTGVSFYEGKAGNHATVGFAPGLLSTAPSQPPTKLSEYGGPTTTTGAPREGPGMVTQGSMRPGSERSTQPAIAGPSTAPPPTPVIAPMPPIRPSIGTQAQPGQGATPRADLGTEQNPIPVPPSMQGSAIPPQTSPVMLASAQSPWAIPGVPNPLAARFAAGGAVEQQPVREYTQARYNDGSPIAESPVPPNALNAYAKGGSVSRKSGDEWKNIKTITPSGPPFDERNIVPYDLNYKPVGDPGSPWSPAGSPAQMDPDRYATGGTVEATQLQARVQNPLPGYQMGGTVEPGEEDTEGDTSPVPGFDPNTPMEVRGYTGKFTAAQAAAAQEGDESTPGTDEYWAAVRRQRASLPPTQDPQLVASRPPGQAIPTTGTTPPGQPEQPTGPLDFIAKAISGVAEAVHGGLMGLTRMLGLNAAVPSGAPIDPATVTRMATGEGIKYSPEEVKAIDQKIDPNDVLTPGLKNVARLSAGYDYFKQKGDMTKANKYAASMLATIQDTIRMKGAQALLAGRHGDVEMMAKKLQEGHDQFPDGKVMKVSDVSKDGASYEIIGPDGKVSAMGRATVDDMMKLATGMMNGTEFFKQAGLLGGQATPQQIAKDKRDQAVEEYGAAPGAMTGPQAQWLANKSPEQRAALDKMDWATRDAIFRKESQEQKLSQDQQNEMEAARLTGLMQSAYQQYAEARAQRTDPDQATDIEKAALRNLQATQQALQDWAGAEPGRYKYMKGLGVGLTSPGRSLNILPGEGEGGAGAIPTGVGLGAGTATPRMTSKERQAAQEEADIRRADKAERIGVLSQEQFDEQGKPIGRGKVLKAYGEVLNLQNVQRAYRDAGIEGSPKQKDLEGISKELTDQIPDLDKPELAPIKQRTGAVASVIMNSNDVTAHDAVGMVKAAVDRSVDKDGNPKVPIGITRDGRLRIGDYQPMVVNRQMLTMLADLQQQHARAQATAPTFPGSQAATAGPFSAIDRAAAADAARQAREAPGPAGTPEAPARPGVLPPAPRGGAASAALAERRRKQAIEDFVQNPPAREQLRPKTYWQQRLDQMEQERRASQARDTYSGSTF